MSSKNKLQRFAAMKTMPNVVQYHFGNLQEGFHTLRGQWKTGFFKNEFPIVLELGCGKGEYTVGLGRNFRDKNFIGIDIKGARMYTGASQAIEEKLSNVAFLRTRIDFINAIFGEKEVDEIWITFPDPQKEKPKKRLTSPLFLTRYSHLLKPGGIIHLKTDSALLHEYTKEVIALDGHELLHSTDNIDRDVPDENNFLRSIQTTYEKKFRGKGMPITYIAFRLKIRYGENVTVFPLPLLRGKKIP